MDLFKKVRKHSVELDLSMPTLIIFSIDENCDMPYLNYSSD
jgi:hypothetical protein